MQSSGQDGSQVPSEEAFCSSDVVTVGGVQASEWTVFPFWSRTKIVSPSLFDTAPRHTSTAKWQSLRHNRRMG